MSAAQPSASNFSASIQSVGLSFNNGSINIPCTTNKIAVQYEIKCMFFHALKPNDFLIFFCVEIITKRKAMNDINPSNTIFG